METLLNVAGVLDRLSMSVHRSTVISLLGLVSGRVVGSVSGGGVESRLGRGGIVSGFRDDIRVLVVVLGLVMNMGISSEIARVGSLVVELVSDLGSHAARDGVVHQISQKIQDMSDLLEVSVDNSEDVADERQALKSVVDANQTVVARIRLQVIALHDNNSGSRDSQTVANAGLHEEAQCGTGLLATVAGMDAEAPRVEDTLEADILREIAIEGLRAEHVLSDSASPRNELADAPAATGGAVNAGSVHHVRLEQVGALEGASLALYVLHGITRN